MPSVRDREFLLTIKRGDSVHSLVVSLTGVGLPGQWIIPIAQRPSFLAVEMVFSPCQTGRSAHPAVGERHCIHCAACSAPPGKLSAFLQEIRLRQKVTQALSKLRMDRWSANSFWGCYCLWAFEQRYSILIVPTRHQRQLAGKRGQGTRPEASRESLI
jgi:hypothetical protein